MKNDYSQKIITPNYFMLLSFIAFAAAVIIPLSANRTLASKYAVIVYLCIFIVYTINYYIITVECYNQFKLKTKRLTRIKKKQNF